MINFLVRRGGTGYAEEVERLRSRRTNGPMPRSTLVFLSRILIDPWRGCNDQLITTRRLEFLGGHASITSPSHIPFWLDHVNGLPVSPAPTNNFLDDWCCQESHDASPRRV